LLLSGSGKVGCMIAGLVAVVIAECADSDSNHDQFASRVAKRLNDPKKARVITRHKKTATNGK
jgi:hypothetical protein